MSGYALLSEVYQDEDLKPKKRDKKKKKREKEKDAIVPLSPQEMDTELLSDMSEMRESPYSHQESLYQGVGSSFDNEHIMEPYSRPIRSLGPHPSYSKDPEYLEFLDFKEGKRRQASNSVTSPVKRPDDEVSTLTSTGDQFNELLLYMFTGFFLLVLYDNIYKLGRDAY